MCSALSGSSRGRTRTTERSGFGVAPGEEEGAEVMFDGAYKLETEEFITGEYYMEMSSIGADCSGYRAFEIEFLEPLSEKDYAKLEGKMQKALKKARETLDEHREQIDAYLEDTHGGKAFGGRNSIEHEL
jgi:Lon protease-like protein